MKQSDLPLIRPLGVKLPSEALRWLAEVERLFPGATKDIIIVRQKPIPTNTARVEVGNLQRERVTAK